MKGILNFLEGAYDKLLSDRSKNFGERLILGISICSYLLHLGIILLANWGIISLDSKFLTNPIAAIYTPFSFILVYEVYLLIFFLPKSISFYIGKQYEIITLIVIRRIFKDIASIELTEDWFQVQSDIQFTFDAITSVLLFILIYFFYKNVLKRNTQKAEVSAEEEDLVTRFIRLKKIIAALLVPMLIILAVFSLYRWGSAALIDYRNGVEAFKNINNIFFDEFFTVLIVVDVLLLLASFFYSDKFYKIIRNSGFIISTILIKISFSTEGLINDALILGAVSFGFVILLIHNMFEKNPVVHNI